MFFRPPATNLERHEQGFALHAVEGEVDTARVGGAGVPVLHHRGQGRHQSLQVRGTSKLVAISRKHEGLYGTENMCAVYCM